jgi:hypothetical protein
MVDWPRLVRFTDDAVDKNLGGEPILLKPMSEASDLDAYAVDAGRAQVGPFLGIYLHGPAKIEGEGAGKEIAGAEARFSVQTRFVPDYIKTGDRIVRTSKGNQELEIVWIEPDAVSRTKLHCIFVR